MRQVLQFALFSFALTAPASAQCELARFRPTPLTPGTSMGASAAIDGDIALVGVNKSPAVFDRVGELYLLEHGVAGWSQTQVLQAPIPENRDQFGLAVAISGDTFIVGAPGTFDPGRGAVYAYRRIAGVWTAETIDSPPGVRDFGEHLAFDGDRAVIATGSPSYVVRVYEKLQTGWSSPVIVQAPDQQTFSHFGRALAIDGDWLAVGAPQHDHNANALNIGVVEMFERTDNGWEHRQQLRASDWGEEGRFGYALALEDQRLVVGTLSNTDRSAVYVFELGAQGWDETAILEAWDREWDPGDVAFNFGAAVDLSGERIVVGSGFNDDGVYLFEHVGNDEWLQRAKTVRSTTPWEGFGGALALDGDRLVVGSWFTGASPGVSGFGEGTLFELGGSGSMSNFCTANEHSGGESAHIFAAGPPTISDNDFLLRALNVLPSAPCLFFYGPVALQAPFGDGLRCVGGHVSRLRITQAAPDGRVEAPLDFTTRPAASGAGRIDPGSTWHFQLIYRDTAAGAAGFNLTEGLAVTFCP